ncbi:hypothetical protein SLE2022_173940 [Rubroshorea leprosula]
MSSDFKINEGCEKGEEYSTKGSEDTDLSMLRLEVEQNRGDEEEDDMAIRLEMQEINVQNEVRHTDVVASLAGDTSAIVMVGQLNGQEKSRLGTNEATEEKDSVTGGTIEKHEEVEENTSGGLERLTSKHLMSDGLEKDERQVLLEMETCRESIGNSHSFEIGEMSETGWENFSKGATDKNAISDGPVGLKKS